MSFSLFNLQREHHEAKETEFASNIVIDSKNSCIIPKWEFCAGSTFATPTISKPSSYLLATYNDFTTIKDGDGGYDGGTRINLTGIDLPKDYFWRLHADNYWDGNNQVYISDYTLSNKISVDALNHKVTYIKEVFAIELTGTESWITWTTNSYTHNNTPCTSIQGSIKSSAPFSTSGPFQVDLRCSHFSYDTTGGGNPTIQNHWCTWGPSMWLFYNVSGISSVTAWTNFLKAQYNAGTPVTIYTPRDLPDYSDFYREYTDITTTALGQYLLNLTVPFSQGIGQMTYKSSCELNTTAKPLLKLYYLDNR